MNIMCKFGFNEEEDMNRICVLCRFFIIFTCIIRIGYVFFFFLLIWF